MPFFTCVSLMTVVWGALRSLAMLGYDRLQLILGSWLPAPQKANSEE